MVQKAALYCRLSRDDGDNSESQSIASQKKYLADYALKNNIEVFDTYADDGYTGTNFDRPDFTRMINDIEHNKVQVVIVKDLSRLGRNYLKTGHYIEEYFPEHNIRFIAINDNYDSSDKVNEFAPFMNIMNEWYAKDISKKITTSHRLNQEKGVVPTGKLPLYGYLYDDLRNRVIDPVASLVVKRIFIMYLSGFSVSDIISSLKKDKIVTPGYYFYLKLGYSKNKYATATEDEMVNWQPCTINHILKSREYCGDLVVRKTHNVSFKNHKTVLNSEEDTLVFKHKFPAIITDDDFKKAALIRKNHSHEKVDPQTDRYKGLLFCKNCGKKLGYRSFDDKNIIAYRCINPKCDCKTFITLPLVDQILKDEIRRLIKVYSKNKKLISNYATNYMQVELKSRTAKLVSLGDVSNLRERNVKLNKLIEKLFESKADNLIPEETYYNMMNNYKTELSQNTECIRQIEEKQKELSVNIDYDDLVKKFFKMLEDINLDKEISFEIASSVFEKVEFAKHGKACPTTVKFYYREIGPFMEDLFNEGINE